MEVFVVQLVLGHFALTRNISLQIDAYRTQIGSFATFIHVLHVFILRY